MDDEQAFQMTGLPQPPTEIGAYVRECPVCHAGPGEWCRARFTLPRGIPLRVPHDARKEA